MDCQFFSSLPDPTVEFLQANRISSKLKKLWQNSATSFQSPTSNPSPMLDNTLQVSSTTPFTLSAPASFISTAQLEQATTTAALSQTECKREREKSDEEKSED